jgi:hypothetical protein
VCTEPNHSDTDGAITQSQDATRVLKLFFEKPLNILILFLVLLFFILFNRFRIFFDLFESMILNTKIVSSSFINSGKASIR